MTGAWFRTLSLWEEYPARLFSIGQRFRREQRQDKSHLFESTSASLVIMDDNFDISQGRDLTKEILKRLGFNFCDFKVKSITSNYYEVGTDTEVYIKDDRNNSVEVANLGFYAKQALGNYRIKYKVFNVGFGVERIAGILFKTDDIRLLVYPYLEKEKILTDEEIANQIDLFKQPKSEEGARLINQLVEIALRNKKKIGPVEILIYEDKLMNKPVKIWIYNWDKGKPLLSYAAENEIFVYNGEIFGLPAKVTFDSTKNTNLIKKFKEIYENGVNTRLKYIDMIFTGFIADLEDYIINKKSQFLDKRFRIITSASQLNLHIPEDINQYLQANNKKINIYGPLFFGIKANIG
jgi:O-phosphoseryl-tRNA synthetase